MCALSSADRVPGYEPVGQRFESSRARQKQRGMIIHPTLFFVHLTDDEPLKCDSI